MTRKYEKIKFRAVKTSHCIFIRNYRKRKYTFEVYFVIPLSDGKKPSVLETLDNISIDELIERGFKLIPNGELYCEERIFYPIGIKYFLDEIIESFHKFTNKEFLSSTDKKSITSKKPL